MTVPSIPGHIQLSRAFDTLLEKEPHRDAAAFALRMALATEALEVVYLSAARKALGFAGAELLAPLPTLPWAVSYINPQIVTRDATGAVTDVRWISHLPSNWPHGGPEHVGPDIAFDTGRIPAFPDWPEESQWCIGYVNSIGFGAWLSSYSSESDVLCPAPSQDDEPELPGAYKRRMMVAVIEQVFPNGVPKGLRLKERDALLNKALAEADPSIRAVGERQWREFFNKPAKPANAAAPVLPVAHRERM
jgi:hypothetical protein